MKRVHYAWIVAAVTFIALMGAAGFRATPSVLIVPLQNEFGWNRAVISVAVSINLARGNAIDCGCFDPSPRPKSRLERLDDMRFVIYRDLGMLLMVGQLWYAARRGQRIADSG